MRRRVGGSACCQVVLAETVIEVALLVWQCVSPSRRDNRAYRQRYASCLGILCMWVLPDRSARCVAALLRVYMRSQGLPRDRVNMIDSCLSSVRDGAFILATEPTPRVDHRPLCNLSNQVLSSPRTSALRASAGSNIYTSVPQHCRVHLC